MVRGFDLAFESNRVSIPAMRSYYLATLMSSDRTKQICMWMTICVCVSIYIYRERERVMRQTEGEKEKQVQREKMCLSSLERSCKNNAG